MLRFVMVVALALVAATATAQTDPRTNTGGRPIDPTVPSLSGSGALPKLTMQVRVGERAPDFDLLRADGSRFRLKQSRGTWVALFFTDGRGDFDRIDALAHTLDSLQVRTYVVSGEKVQAIAAWKPEVTPHLVPLADETGEISAIYGLWDAPRRTTRPGLFLIDPHGIVKLALLGQKVGPPSVPGLVQMAVEGL